MVGQTAIVNRLLWMQDRYPLSADDVVAQKTPCSFDVSVWEFWWPFIAGAQLVMAEPEAHRDPQAMQQFFARYGVTTTHFCAVDAGGVCRLAGCRQRRCLPHAAAGILQRRSAADGIVPRVGALNRRRCNLYGPTEAAVDVSWYPACGPELAAVTGSSVPMAGRCGTPGCAFSMPRCARYRRGGGDLYLTGISWRRAIWGAGSHRQPLYRRPVCPGERMYRTGDVALADERRGGVPWPQRRSAEDPRAAHRAWRD